MPIMSLFRKPKAQTREEPLDLELRADTRKPTVRKLSPEERARANVALSYREKGEKVPLGLGALWNIERAKPVTELIGKAALMPAFQAYQTLKSVGIAKAKGERITPETLVTPRKFSEFGGFKGFAQSKPVTEGLTAGVTAMLPQGAKQLIDKPVKEFMKELPADIRTSILEAGVDLPGIMATGLGLSVVKAGVKSLSPTQTTIRAYKNIEETLLKDAKYSKWLAERVKVAQSKGLSATIKDAHEAFMRERVYPQLSKNTPYWYRLNKAFGQGGFAKIGISKELQTKYNLSPKQLENIKNGVLTDIPKALIAELGVTPGTSAGVPYQEDVPKHITPSLREEVAKGEALPDKELLEFKPKGLKKGEDFVTYPTTKGFAKRIGEPAKQEALRVAKVEKDITKTGEALAEPIAPGKVKPTIERVTGVSKAINTITTNESTLLRNRLQAETRGAKLGETKGKREIRTQAQAKRKTIDLVKSINSLSQRNIPQDFKDQVESIMAKYDLNFRTSKTLKARESAREFVNRLNEQGEDIPIPTKILDKLDTVTLNNMTIKDLENVKDAISTIVHTGTVKGKLIAGKEIRDFRTVEDEVTKQIFDTAKIKPDVQDDVGFQPPSIRKKTKLQQLTDSADGFFSSHRYVEQIARTLDKFKFGQVQDNIIKPIQDAGDKEMVQIAEANSNVTKALEPIATDLNKFIDVPGLPVKITQEEALMIYLNSQNKGNLQRLVLGNKLSVTQVNGLIDFLKSTHPEIIKTGDKVFDIIESFYPETNKTNLMVTGQRLGKVKGRYFQIITDKELSVQQQYREAKKDLFKETFNRAYVEEGHTKTREGGIDAVALEVSSIFRQLNSVIHYNTHKIPVRDVNKLITSPKIKAAISEAMSPGVYNQFKSWIADVADPRTPSIRPFEKVARTLKNNATKAILGMKFSVSLLQGGSFTQTIHEIGLKDSVKGLVDYWKNPREANEFIRNNSVQQKFRSNNLDREIKDFLDTKEGKTLMTGKLGGDELFFAMIQGVDKLTTSPTWLGAYNKEMRITDGNIEASRREADRVARMTQPQGAIKDLASIARGRPFQKLWTAFYSHFSRYHNLVVSELDKLKFADDSPARKVSNIARAFWWLIVAPVMAATTLRSGGKFKNPKEFGKKIAKESMSYSLGGLIGVRDFVRVLSGQLVGDTFFSTKISPAGFRGLELLAKAPGKKEVKDKVVTGARALGILTGKIPEQAFVTLEGIEDLMSGQTRDLRRLFLTRGALGERKKSKKKKKRSRF